MLSSIVRRVLSLAAVAFLSCHSLAQVGLKESAVVYFGSASNTTSPATIDETRVKEATPEWQTIKTEDVKKGSARYKILVAEMCKRIREAVKGVASKDGRDLVVRKDDIEDSKGKNVTDITDAVIQKLGQIQLAATAGLR